MIRPKQPFIYVFPSFMFHLTDTTPDDCSPEAQMCHFFLVDPTIYPLPYIPTGFLASRW